MDKGFNEKLALLRRKIRQAGRQYRQNNDNSQSLFHPSLGFTYAYDIPTVEAALDEFERSLGLEPVPQSQLLDPRQMLLQEAKMLAEVHPSKDTRDFANDVIRFLMNPLRGGEVAKVEFTRSAQEQNETETH